MNKNINEFQTIHPNLNILWANLFIEELVRNDIVDICIAPGSRSTPLTLAASNNKKIKTHIHFDERGLGFLALGIAKQSNTPVVVITTSGTAVANLYPAIVEAKQSSIPLIILTADRPPELLDCAANQAIDQSNIFSNYPVCFNQIPTPVIQIPPNYLLTTIDQALSKQKELSGSIHFNLSFPDPLYPNQAQINYQEYLTPLNNWLVSELPFTSYIKAEPHINSIDISYSKIIVVVGRVKSIEEADIIEEFASNNDFILFADIQSNLSGSVHNINNYDHLLTRSEFNEHLDQAQLIIQFGDHLISKELNLFINSFKGNYWIVNKGNNRIDPSHKVEKRFCCSPTNWIKNQSPNNLSIDLDWKNEAHTFNKKAETLLTNFIGSSKDVNEINVVHSTSRLAPNNSNLFIANSMPIRLFDNFNNSFHKKNDRARIFTNRGASGIDGLIATSIGVALKSKQTTTLLIGDTSFLYDLNSLALLNDLQTSFIIILINNDGGAIFNHLPVPTDQKEIFYQNPHKLTFENSCKQFSIKYTRAFTIDEFELSYTQALNKGSTLIEICVPNSQNFNQLKLLKEQIQNATFN